MELFGVTGALIMLKIPSTNQITENWRQRVREIIRTGNSQKLFSEKYFVYLGTVRNSYSIS